MQTQANEGIEHDRHGRILVGGTVLTCCPGGGLRLIAFRETESLRHPGASTYDDLLVAGAGWALLIGIGWAALLCSAAVLEVVSSGRLAFTAGLGCPAPVRRALLAGLGVVLAERRRRRGRARRCRTAPARQAERSCQPGAPRAGQADRRDIPPCRGSGRGPSPATTCGASRRSELARGRDAQDVARLVERTYRANRRVIGPDPDLIQPGNDCRLPHSAASTPPPHPTETP